MKLFIYRGKIESESKMQAELIKRCLRVYIIENSRVNKKLNEVLESIENAEIKRTLKGKPYVEIDGLEFSVSHSGDMWACAVSDTIIGADIQEMRDIDALKVSNRFFSESEQSYVRRHGKEGFFDIWVRKEAYVKCLGTGLSEGLGKFTVAEENKLLESVDGIGKYSFMDIEISPEIKCCICSEKIDELKIEFL